jgi:ATP-binding cassette subfamily B protein/subfamily B ATP-binding cassette protein MsbA
LRFAAYLRPVRGLLAAGLAASLVQAVLQWIAPWPLKVIFDSVLASHPVPAPFAWLPADPPGRLAALTLLTVAVAVLLAVTDYVSNRWVAQAGQRVVSTIRADLFGHLQRQSLAFHQKHQTGDLMSRLDSDTQDIQNLTVDVLPTVLNNVATLAGFVVIMLLVNPYLGAVSLIMVPVMYWLVRRYMTRIKAAQRAALWALGDSSGVAQEVLSSLPVVQAFGAEEREAQRFGAANGRQLRASLRAVVLQSAFTPLVALTMAVTTAAVVYLGARSVLAGRLTPGDVLVFSAYLRGMYTPVRQLAKLAGVTGRGQAAADRVAQILDTDAAVPEPAHPRRLAQARGSVTLAGVDFSYQDGTCVLRQVNLEIPAGARQALVGQTGSGKSTILRLIPRFADPAAGAVLLDGTDIRHLHLADLRRQIALVPQEAYLFRATIWENIAYGLTEMTRSAAIRAARAAGVHDVIASMPGGYDAVVAERGASLSGGQRQCVALARALARNAPILLLDEPTTGLDVETESVLLDALDRVSTGRTTVMVSHQFGAVRGADMIAVLENGRITERGTHHELARSGRTYSRLDALSAGRAAFPAAATVPVTA